MTMSTIILQMQFYNLLVGNLNLIAKLYCLFVMNLLTEGLSNNTIPQLAVRAN